MDIENLVRKNIRSLKPYSSARDEFSGRGEVFLDANECPFESVRETIISSGYNRYPDPQQKDLKKAIADLKGVSPSSVFIGNGSDEPIDLLIRAFCEPGRDSILINEPTYGMYQVAAQINNVNIQRCRLTSTFELDYQSMQKTLDETSRIIFLCNPNNPTGNLFDKDVILKVIKEFSGLVVVDEAYIDFTEDEGFVRFIEQFPNLVVLQTFSKAWGLASLRIGMCFANPAVINALSKIKPPYNVNGVSQQVALRALAEKGRMQKHVQEILAERKRVAKELSSLNIVVKVYASETNFLLIKFKDAGTVNAYLRSLGIIVRDRSNEINCENCLRITIGTTEENQKLINALKSYE